MRMWMVDPRTMCSRHLLGEHVELHMFVGTIKRKKSLDGYIKNNCVEPKSIKKRHDLLVKEMKKRGWKGHKTEIENPDISYLKNINVKVDKEKSLEDLINRCSECRKRKDSL